MKKSFLILKSLLVFLLFCLHVNAQTDNSWKLVKTITGNIADFTTDNLGNIFLISDNQQVKKLNDRFDSVGIFNDVRRYGKLYSIDASNPMKLLLYYREFSTIVVLDRFLNTINIIDLRKADIFQCRAITQSFDNNIWLFDDQDYKIKKIDDGGKLLSESNDFRILFDDPPRPEKIEDYNRFLYLYDSVKGLSIFDYYGTLKNQVAFKNLKDVQGFSKGVIARDDKGLIYYEPASITTTQKPLPVNAVNAVKIKISGSKLFSMPAPGILEVYQLP